MKIYLDLVLFLNFMFDLLLLLTVKIILKRKTTLKRTLLASVIGSLSIFFLFIKLNTITLFLLKIIISILMVIIQFGKKDLIKNILYLYFTSIILGGFIYYLNIEFSYKNIGLVFFNNGFSINYILLLILSPIILYLYIKQNKELKIRNNLYYQVEFSYKNKKYKYIAYLDTGNKLYDPYGKTPVIILYDNNIKINKPIYIPYKTINNTGLLEAFKLDEIIINDEKINKKIIVALSKEKIKIDGVEMLLHRDLIL